jgi:hypothetical protein
MPDRVDAKEQQPEPDDSSTEPAAARDDNSDLFSYLQRDIPDEPSHLEGEGTIFDGTSGEDIRDYGPPALEDGAENLLTDSGAYPDSYTDERQAREHNLELAEDALNMGNLGEAKKLLGFDSANLAEEIRRKYLLAAYYLACERPIQALVVLKSVQLTGLSRSEKRDFLLRIAECYQQLHNFEAAHSVYMRIMADHPDAEVAERMAKVNYERYLRRISGEEPVLEKITSL